MSKSHEWYTKRADRKIFEGIIQESELRDAGIARFEKKMQRYERELTRQYAGTLGVDHGKLREIESSLDDEWEHAGYTATVTGRLYISEEELRELLPDEWGALEIDEQSDSFFSLQDVQLVSQGVRVAPVMDYDTGLVKKVEVAYLFTSVLDETFDDEEGEGVPVLKASPRDLWRHQYDTPTAEEIEFRLQRRWPEEYALLVRLIRPDLQSAMPRRLQMIADRLQPELQKSEEFRHYVTVFIANHLELDQHNPYAMMIPSGGEVKIFHGKDIYAPDTTGQWLDVDVTEPLFQYAHEPEVHLSVLDNTVQPLLVAKIFNRDDGIVPEIVGVQARDISMFRSTTALHSVADVALRAKQLDDEAKQVATASTEAIATIVQPPILESELQTYIKRLEYTQKVLNNFIEKVSTVSRGLYLTHDEAEAAAASLIEEFMTTLSQHGIRLGECRVVITGEGIKVARGEANSSEADQTSGVLGAGLDKNEPLQDLDPMDQLEASLISVLPIVVTLKNEDTVVGFRAEPHLVAVTQRQTVSMGEWGGVSLAVVNQELRAMIPLGESVDAKLVELELYRTRHKQAQEFNAYYGRHPIVDHINRLKQAFMSDVSNVVPLRHVELLTQIDADIKSLAEQGLKEELAMEVLESHLLQKAFWVKGELRTRNKEVVRVEDGNGVRGTVVDVRRDVEGDSITLVLKTDDHRGVQYIALSKITALMF